MLKGGKVKMMYELHGEGIPIRQITKVLGISRNTVRKYLREPGIPAMRPRPSRSSKLAPFEEHLERRLSEGVDNCVVLLRELRAIGYTGGYTILKEYVKPFRRLRQPSVTMRFETEPGEQAQVDWMLLRYRLPDGQTRRVWAFVMVMSWSRAIYVEFAPRADEAAFLRCHAHAFTFFGGVPAKILYDNAKVVVLERDSKGQPVWNERFLDFSLRLGFDARLCHPYRPQTKGRVESGVKYVRRNFWPTATFTDLDDLNHGVLIWVESVANVRIHGTTGERPVDRLEKERVKLKGLPEVSRLQPFLRETRKVQRDGFVSWDGSFYGVPVRQAGTSVEVQPKEDTVEIWSGDKLLALHPRAKGLRRRLPIPGQWEDLKTSSARPGREPVASFIPEVTVEHRPLDVYEEVLMR